MESASAKFEVVFEGQLAPQRNAEEVLAGLEKHFGEALAQRMLTSERLVLKRDLERGAAEKLQQQLFSLGLLTRLELIAPAEVELSLAEDYVSPKAVKTAPTGDAGAPATTATPAKPTQRGQEEMKPRQQYPLSQIDDSFQSAIDMSATVSKGYTGYLLIVAFLMILLPLIYAAVVFLFGYATYWHATNNIDWFDDYSGKLVIVGYLVPIIGGILLTAFMLKPFIAAPTERGPQPVRLDPAREPAVFHLVEMITDELGAPMPVTIQVDADVNASASLRKGVFSNELRLTIGMPLFYGMTVEQLTGVLAHEFGHFAQRFGMRFAALIHYINYWFYRQAYQEDSWDELIDSWAESGHALVTLSALVASFGAWLTRMMLLGLAYVATILSRGLSRQMEFDADRYEIALCGSKGYSDNAKVMRILGAGHSVASDLAGAGLEQGRLPDNIPLMTRGAAVAFDEHARKQIIAGIQDVNASVFDTHPPDLERIDAANKMNKPGVFHNGDPAVKLLREPHRLGMHTTLQWYRSHGLEIGPTDVIQSEDFAPQFAAGMRV